MAENLPDNIARWDTEGRYLYINPTQEHLLGVTPADVIGKRLAEAFPSIDFSVLDETIAQVVATGQTKLIHQSVPGENSETQIHDITLAPEFDEEGKIVSVLGIGRDMTTQRRMETAIKKSEE